MKNTQLPKQLLHKDRLKWDNKSAKKSSRRNHHQRTIGTLPKKNQQTSLKKKRPLKKRRILRTILELLLSLVGGCVIALGISMFFATVLTVHGFSMMPTLRDGDEVLIKKVNELQRFDLVAFKVGEGSPQVRRIIGLSGESIRYEADTLYINGQPVDEKFLISAINESQKNGRNYTENFSEKTLVIPEQYYFVLGDNRPYSTDSRHYGLVAKKNIIGKVTTQLFPFNEIKAF